MENTTALSPRAAYGEQLFRQGYNCSQAVVGAFTADMGVDFATAMRLQSAFGGGMGRLRETCGTVTGAFTVLGTFLGSADPKAQAEKAALYAQVQEFARRFRESNGSIVCRELLGLRQQGASEPDPEVRTAKYYACRPCAGLVAHSVTLLEQMLAENGVALAPFRLPETI